MSSGSIQEGPGVSTQSPQVLSLLLIEIEIYKGVEAVRQKLHSSKYLAKFWFSVSHF